MENEQGKRRTVWLSNELDAKVEDVRKKLGLGRSGFYRYAIVEIIKQFAVTPVFEKEVKQNGSETGTSQA